MQKLDADGRAIPFIVMALQSIRGCAWSAKHSYYIPKGAALKAIVNILTPNSYYVLWDGWWLPHAASLFSPVLQEELSIWNAT